MRQVQNALNENHAMLIKYKCTSCGAGEHDVTVEQHGDIESYWECDCGELMLPLNHELISNVEERLAKEILFRIRETKRGAIIEAQLAAHAEVVEAARSVVQARDEEGFFKRVHTDDKKWFMQLMQAIDALAAALAKLEAWK